MCYEEAMSDMLKESADRSRALAELAHGPMKERLLKLAEDYEERAGKPGRKPTPATLAMRLNDQR